MKDSLRSLMIVAILAPAVLAGAYFLIRLPWILSQLPPTQEFPPIDDPSATKFVATKGSWRTMTIMVGDNRIIEFPYDISDVSAEHLSGIELVKLSPHSVRVTGRSAGECGLYFSCANDDQQPIHISVKVLNPPKP
jgi:hypothetical protein